MRVDPPVIKNAAIGFMLLAALLAGFFILFEKAEKTVFTPGSAEARRNPFLAAERFLSDCGIEAESTDQREILMKLPPTDALIFINRLGGNLPQKREDRLIEWIKNGGTLVITHNRLWREGFQKSGNKLLDRLSVRQYDARERSLDKASKKGAAQPSSPTARPPASGGMEEAQTDGAATPCTTQNKEVVRVPVGPDTFAEVCFISRYILEDASEAESKIYGGKTGAHIIDRQMGRGRLIVLSDNEFMHNANIGRKDHAFYLARLCLTRGKVWIQYRSRMPSFVSIVWGKAPFFFISLLVFVVFYIAWLTIRIGPRYIPGDDTRRDITEHLLAAGQLTWRHDPKKLVEEARAALHMKMAMRMETKPAAGNSFRDRPSRDRRYAAIARRTGLSTDAVVFALTADIDRPSALVKATAILQQINSTIGIQKKRGLF